ncbi:hypothetical protein [Streptomyces sp. NPDC046727]
MPRASATLPPRPIGFTGRTEALDRLLPCLAPAPRTTARHPS